MSGQSVKRPIMDLESESDSSKDTFPNLVYNLTTQKFAPIIDTLGFVDKTLFIKAFLEAKDNMIVALAPRRIGKSTNLDMVKEFLTGNRTLFIENNLKIYEREREFFIEYCKENPVIDIDFKDLFPGTSEEVLEAMSQVVQEAYKDHRCLVKKNGDNWTWTKDNMEEKTGFTVDLFIKYLSHDETLSREDIIKGLRRLSKCLHAHYEKKVYVLIDEYDSAILGAIQRSYTDQQVANAIDLISDVISNFLKDNDNIIRVLIIAIAQIAAILPSDTNIKHYAFLQKPEFAPFFGFTTDEVENLFDRTEFQNLRDDENIEKYYKGYQVPNTGDFIYSSCSILSYLQRSKSWNKKIIESYWVDSGYIPKMRELFAKREIQRLIETLLDDEEVQITKFEKLSRDDVVKLKDLVRDDRREPGVEEAHMVLQFLADSGYLNVIRESDPTEGLPRTCFLRVPNIEIKRHLLKNCYDTEMLKSKYQLDYKKIEAYVWAVQSVLEKSDKNAFVRFAKAVSELFGGARMPIDDDELHRILFTLTFNAFFFIRHHNLSVRRVRSNATKEGASPLGILIILRNVGVIIEVKFETESSDAALTQIKTSEFYPMFFKDKYKDVTSKIYVGLHLDKHRNVTLSYSTSSSLDWLIVSSNMSFDK